MPLSFIVYIARLHVYNVTISSLSLNTTALVWQSREEHILGIFFSHSKLTLSTLHWGTTYVVIWWSLVSLHHHSHHSTHSKVVVSLMLLFSSQQRCKTKTHVHPTSIYMHLCVCVCLSADWKCKLSFSGERWDDGGLVGKAKCISSLSLFQLAGVCL